VGKASKTSPTDGGNVHQGGSFNNPPGSPTKRPWGIEAPFKGIMDRLNGQDQLHQNRQDYTADKYQINFMYLGIRVGGGGKHKFVLLRE